MRRFLKALFFVPLAVLIIVFAVANRAPVIVSLDPFGNMPPALSVELPLFVLLFAVALLGVIAGGIGAWFGQSARRRAAREAERELSAKRSELERLRAARPEPAETLPSLIR